MKKIKAIFDYLFVQSLILYTYLFPQKHLHQKSKSGKLIVCGRDFVIITLPHKPKHYDVSFNKNFCHDNVGIPCNPVIEDQLYYSLYKADCGYELIIEWEVSSCKEIEWTIAL